MHGPDELENQASTFDPTYVGVAISATMGGCARRHVPVAR